MPVYRIRLTAWQSRPRVPAADGEHTVVFAVRACDGRDARDRVFRHGVGFQPATGAYSLRGGLGPGATLLDEFHINSVRRSRARVRMHVWRALSVCTDCMLAIANGEYGERPDLPDPLCEVAGEDVVLGTDEHSEGHSPADRDEGCDCGDLGFRTSRCDGCGDSHHGDRFAAAVLRERVGSLWLERI
jgi:hypothetical protein